LFVSNSTQNCSADFYNSRWTGSTWVTKKSLDFAGNPDHVTLRLDIRYGFGYGLDLTINSKKILLFTYWF